MSSEPFTKIRERKPAKPASLDFRALFEFAPGLFVVVLPDQPIFTIVAASEAYLQAVKKSREELVGRSLFEVFPEGPDPAHAATLHNLRASFARVLATGQPDAMPVQQYDILRPDSEGGGFEERHWSPLNSPIPGADGSVQFIVNRVEDVTEFARLKRREAEHGRLAEAERIRADRMEAELFLRSRELAQVKQLTQEHRLLSLLAEHSPQFIGISDLHGAPVYANRAAMILVGARDFDEIKKTSVPDYFVPEERAFVQNVVLPAVREQGRWQGELRLQHLRTQEPIPVLYDVFRVDDPATERPTHFATVVRDMRERKRAERRDAFLVQLDDAVRPLTGPHEITQTVAKLLGEYLEVNRCAYADVEEDQDTFNLTGDYNRGVASIVGRYTFTGYGAECLRLMREGQPYVVEDAEADPRTADVRESYRLTRIGAVICVPLLKSGRFVAAMAVHQVTPRPWRPDEVELTQQVANRCWESIERARVTRELQEREQRYRFLAESIPQMVWTATPDGMLDYVNRQGAEYFGAAQSALLGAGWLAWVHPEERERTVERWKHSLATGQNYETAFRLRRGDDDSWRWHLVRALPLVGEDGRVAQWCGTCTDIEDQKQAEADLHQQWRTFDTALSHMPDFTYIFDLEGRFTYVNRALLGLWQKPLKEALGKNFFELDYPPELAGRLQRQIQQVIDTKKTVRDQTPFTGPSGETRHYEYTFVAVLAASGQVEAVAGSTRDITESNRAEALVQDDRRRWRDLLLQTPAAIAVLRGPEHRFEWVNPEYVRMVGRPAEALIGQTVLEAVPEVGGQIYINLLNGVYQTGEPFSGHESLVRLERDGVLQNVYVNFIYLATRDIAGEIDGIFAHITDVTGMVLARQHIEESERQFRTLAESIPNLAWMADETGHIFWYNRRWYDYTGTTFEEMEGWGWQKVHDPAVLPEVLAGWTNAIASREPFEMVFPLKGANGAFRSFLTRVEPVKDNEGRVVRWFGANTDITDQRRTEEELRRVNRGLEEFAYVASHDLQEPLRMVNSYSQLLLKRLGPQANADLQQFADYISTGVQRMERLIRDLLTYSRETHSLAEATDARADLADAFRQALTLVETRIRESGAQVTVDALPVVAGEVGQLAHVFQNLLSNAIKYRKAGEPPRIHISAARRDAAWVVSMRDNGIGFAQSHAERIFGLFKRLHRDEEYAGTGLGLAICKRIVERYGGRMWAESEEGVGSTFFFTLPAA